MATFTETTRDAAFILSEATGYRSRDEGTVTVPAGGYVAGTVLGQITATGKFVRHDPVATDGSEAEAAILMIGQAIPGDAGAALIARDAEVDPAALTFADGADAAQITATIAALAERGIICR